MRRVPLRWFLPIFHFVMDLILVSVLILDERAELRREKRPSTLRTSDAAVRPIALTQESGVVEFDPRFIYREPSPPLALFASAAPLTTLVLSWMMPQADLQRIAWRPIEWWWLAAYEATAVLLWILLGSAADRNLKAVYRWCLALIMIRLFALAIVASPIWKLGPVLQVLFWLSAIIALVADSLWRLTRRIHVHPPSV